MVCQEYYPSTPRNPQLVTDAALAALRCAALTIVMACYTSLQITRNSKLALVLGANSNFSLAAQTG